MRDCPLATWVMLVHVRLAYRCALRTRYVQLLLGFFGTVGGLAGLVLPLSKCLVNQDSESDRVFLGEGLFLR